MPSRARCRVPGEVVEQRLVDQVGQPLFELSRSSHVEGVGHDRAVYARVRAAPSQARPAREATRAVAGSSDHCWQSHAKLEGAVQSFLDMIYPQNGYIQE